MKKLFAFLAVATLLAGCSDPQPPVNDSSTVNAIPVATVDLGDEAQIIKAVGEPVLSQTKEDAETRYFFRPKGQPGFQVEIDPSTVVVAWFVYSDSPKHAAANEANVALAKRTVIAIAGEPGLRAFEAAMEGRSGIDKSSWKQIRYFGGGSLGMTSVTVPR